MWLKQLFCTYKNQKPIIFEIETYGLGTALPLYCLWWNWSQSIFSCLHMWFGVWGSVLMFYPLLKWALSFRTTRSFSVVLPCLLLSMQYFCQIAWNFDIKARLQEKKYFAGNHITKLYTQQAHALKCPWFIVENRSWCWNLYYQLLKLNKFSDMKK